MAGTHLQSGDAVSAASVTATNLAGGGTQCLQTNNSGAVSGTGSACGSGSGGSGIVSPGTFTWTNTYGVSFSTIAVSTITSTTDILLDPVGDVKVRTGTPIMFYDNDNSNFVSIGAASNVTTNANFTIAGDGTNGQVLTTNGSGALTFTTVSGGGSGSGTVNASAQYNVPYYSVTGSSNVLSGSSVFTFNGTTVTVLGPVIASSGITTGNGSSTGYWEALTGTSPGNPASTYYRMYFDSGNSNNLTSRDSSGVTKVYASTASNVATATALAANPTDCGGGQYANAIDASGNLTCGTPSGGSNTFTSSVTFNGGTNIGDPFDTTISILSEDFYSSSLYSQGANSGASDIRIDACGGAAGTTGGADGTANHPGIAVSQTGTVSGRGNSYHYAHSAAYGSIVVSTQTFDSHWIYQYVSTTTGQDIYAGFISASMVTSATPTNGCWVRKLTADTNFQFVCTNGTPTVVDSGVAPAASTYYTAKIYSTTAGTIKFRIWSNGSALGSEQSISTNLPTNGLTPVFIHTGDGTNRVINFDRIAVKVTGLAR